VTIKESHLSHLNLSKMRSLVKTRILLRFLLMENTRWVLEDGQRPHKTQGGGMILLGTLK